MISPSFVVYVIVTVAVPIPSVLILVTEVSLCENDSVTSRIALSLLDQLQLPSAGPAFACRFIDVPSMSSLLTIILIIDNNMMCSSGGGGRKVISHTILIENTAQNNIFL